MTIREERIEIVNEMANEWGFTFAETVYCLLFDHYEAAGFTGDQLVIELDGLSESELLDLFCNI